MSVLPRLLQLSPDTLAPGGVVVIEGEHLDAPLDSIRLTVGGVVVPVYRATATRIEARVPTDGLPCVATASQPVALMVAGTTLFTTVPVRWAHPLALEPGESANVLSADAARCVELVVPTRQRARYVVAVVNTSEAETSSDAFELRGTGLGAMAGVLSAVPTHGTVGGTVPEMPSMLRLPMAAESRHDAWLDAQRNMVARAGSATRWWGAARDARATHGTMEAPSIMASAMMAPASALKGGDVVTMRAPFNSCTAGAQVTARVVYAGATSVVLEDVAAPQAGTMDADYRAIGEEFDRVQYPLLRQNIGDPLAMNGAMHGDGRVTLLFTRFLNDSVPGVAGYVSACNFYPTRTFAASNEDEVIYGRVAMGAETAADWRRSMRSTVMHEAKHLASFAERMAGSTRRVLPRSCTHAPSPAADSGRGIPVLPRPCGAKCTSATIARSSCGSTSPCCTSICVVWRRSRRWARRPPLTSRFTPADGRWFVGLPTTTRPARGPGSKRWFGVVCTPGWPISRGVPVVRPASCWRTGRWPTP